MYATCLFCNGDLGRNEAIDAFPVGRRLAFDAAKGRLWVVCRRCERWNLTPLEERWEAIEECERAFQGTKLRMSTDEIGLARLKEGLELVRIGAPQRPEMAAWRYGDQFGRRRTRTIMLTGAVVVATGGYILAGPLLGILGGGAMSIVNLSNLARSLYRSRAVAARVTDSNGSTLLVTKLKLDKTTLVWSPADRRWSLDIAHRPVREPGVSSWRDARESTVLTGDDAIRAARQILPAINASGARRGTVREAVGYLEESPHPDLLFGRVGRSFGESRSDGRSSDKRIKVKVVPTAVRLALEMAAHEETERRAIEGELHILEAAWRDAEEIAHIADDMFLPASVDEDLERLKRLADRGDSSDDPR